MSNQNPGGTPTPSDKDKKDKRSAAAQPLVKPGTNRRPRVDDETIARLRERRASAVANAPSATPRLTSRQLSRFEKDQRRQRYLIFSVIGIIAIIVLVLGIGIFASLIAPNLKTLADFNGESISSGDYFKYRKLELFETNAQIQQLLDPSSGLGGQNAQQFQQQLQQNQQEINGIQNTDLYPFNQSTLERMVADRVSDKAARDEFGINPSDDDLNRALNDKFGASLRLYTPTPDQAGVKATAVVSQAQVTATAIVSATALAITPLPTPTPSVSPTSTTAIGATPSVSATASVSATTGVSVTASVSATGSVSATTSPTATTAPVSPTLTGDKIQTNINNSKKQFFDSLRTTTGLTEDDYKKLRVRADLVKSLVSTKLNEKVPQVGAPVKQLKASYIVLPDEATAKDLLAKIKAEGGSNLEATFAKYAREQSTDKVTAAKNGDRGWFIRYQFGGTATEPDTFYDAADKLQVGQVSDPVKNGNEWQLILLTGKEDARPLDAIQYQSELQTVAGTSGDYLQFALWQKQKVDAAKASYKTPPTPTTQPTQIPPPKFTPVVPPTPTVEVPTQPVETTAIVGPVQGATTAASSTTAAPTTASSTTAAPTTTAASTTVAPTTTAAPTTANP